MNKTTDCLGMFGKTVPVSSVYYTFILLAQCQEVSCGPPCFIAKMKLLFGSESIKEGNIVIGGVFSVSNFFNVENIHFNTIPLPFCSL